MNYKIIVTPNAIQNIDDATYYYKNKVSDKVAKLFIDDYKKTSEEIRKTKYFQLYFQDFRGKPMRKFPFIVFYTINEFLKVIVIKAIFHTAQNHNKYPYKTQ